MHHLRPALVLIVLFTLLTGIALPLAFVGIGQAAFPFQANGSLIERDGHVVGSALLGQQFAADGYFHPRPSATTEPDPNDSTKTVPVPYAADSSGASNYGATSQALIDRVKADVAELTKTTGQTIVPADAVTTSASGLDPDISPANAESQVARVAEARKVPAETVRRLVDAQTKGRLFGFVGEPRVNVLALNLALDASVPAATPTAAAQ